MNEAWRYDIPIPRSRKGHTDMHTDMRVQKTETDRQTDIKTDTQNDRQTHGVGILIS